MKNLIDHCSKLTLANTLQNSTFSVDIGLFKQKALQYAHLHFDHICHLEGNNISYLHGSFPQVLAFGAERVLEIENSLDSFRDLIQFQNESKHTLFGIFSYDLKNELENLKSENQDFVKFPKLIFFEPKYLIEFQIDTVNIRGENPAFIFESINNTHLVLRRFDLEIKSRISRNEYIQKVKEIQSSIQKGDIYELNFCQEFYAENAEIEPVQLFFKLNEISQMPFSAFFKSAEKYLICASPERFLKKTNQTLVSQPIKGTVKRGRNEWEDHELRNSLSHSEKELAENVMIVDLVRNDLSKTALDGSVKVEELFGIYSFSNVHQMISTVVSTLDPQFRGIEALKNAFPMGSMTGAPKVNAMELIEKFEQTKRGVFSGALGYIDANGDYDFNVVIRSILYNSENNYLSFQVGSAITIDADAEKEWEECEIKISAIRKALNAS